MASRDGGTVSRQDEKTVEEHAGSSPAPGSIEEWLGEPETIEVTPEVCSMVEKNARTLEAIEEELGQRANSVLEGAMRFADLSQAELQEDAPPARMVAELGQDEAARQFRVAKYALMPQGEAPMGLHLAKAIQLNVAKAREARRGTIQVLNAAILVLGEPPSYKTVDVDEE